MTDEQKQTTQEEEEKLAETVVETTDEVADSTEPQKTEDAIVEENSVVDDGVKAEEIAREEWQKRIKAGMTVRVHQKIREMNAKGEMKERVQIFEGIVLAHKHGQEAGATIMVRKVSDGVGVEKIFPIHSPNVVKVEIIRVSRVKRAKLFFLRFRRKKGKRLKEIKKD
jgi:large subunit ribosomal protein L19